MKQFQTDPRLRLEQIPEAKLRWIKLWGARSSVAVALASACGIGTPAFLVFRTDQQDCDGNGQNQSPGLAMITPAMAKMHPRPVTIIAKCGGSVH